MMNDRKRNELEENNIDQNTFGLIIYDNKHPLSWAEIMEYLSYCAQTTYSQSQIANFYPKKSFLTQNDFSYLEDLGIDYNHYDSFGNNFLHYMYSNQNDTSSRKEHYFYEEAIDYIASKTHDVYHLNNANQSILFNAISYHTAGINNEHFFSLLKTYPEFNLHQIDKQGRNLLNHALSHHSPPQIIQYFFDQNLSRTHITNNKQNMLSHFSFLSFSDEHRKWFAQLIKEIDIASDPTFENSFLNNWMTFYMSKDVNDSNKLNYFKWINELFVLLSHADFLHISESIQTLHHFLSQHQDKYLKAVKKNEDDEENYILACDLYKNALAGIYYIQMNIDLPQSSHEVASKAKI